MQNTYLVHHGILGQKWGVRRYQNKDGSLTSEGKKHYNTGETKEKKLTDKQKRALVIGVSTVGVGLAAYGTYKVAKAVNTKKAMAAEKLVAEQIARNKRLDDYFWALKSDDFKNSIKQYKTVYNTTLKDIEKAKLTSPDMGSALSGTITQKVGNSGLIVTRFNK